MMNPIRKLRIWWNTRKIKARVEGRSESRTTIDYLGGLRSEAVKAGSFENFRKDYILQMKHGLYFHVTDDPNFEIDALKGPHDYSSLADGSMRPGAFMFTSHLDYWLGEFEDRKFVAILDLSGVPRNEYRQVNRGFGNEFFLNDASGVKVMKVVSRSQAIKIDREHQSRLPQNEKELRVFYFNAIRYSIQERIERILKENYTMEDEERSFSMYSPCFILRDGTIVYTVQKDGTLSDHVEVSENVMNALGETSSVENMVRRGELIRVTFDAIDQGEIGGSVGIESSMIVTARQIDTIKDLLHGHRGLFEIYDNDPKSEMNYECNSIKEYRRITGAK